jgi:F420-dependent oxidoreductase-like protein
MKLGWNLGYWTGGPPDGVPAQLEELERLGYDSFWTAETYGSDVLAPLAWWGSSTRRLRLGTAIMQLSARTPTAAAMAALTMDHLSGGRFVLGLGVSGPQVVEGWYGQPFAAPLARTREYVAIVRAVLAREAPVTAPGPHHPLPLPGGLGKALKASVHPLRAGLPILLAAEGPANVALAAEIADGWLPFLFSPRHERFYADRLAEGFRRAGRSADGFEVVASVPVSLDDDLQRAAAPVRAMLALYLGGMGARGANFHYEVAARMGYEAEAATIQRLYLEGRKAEAQAAVPLALVEELALVGPVAKVRDDLAAWRESLVTTLLVSGPPSVLRTMAELACA